MAKDRQQRPQSAALLGETLSRNLEQRKELPVALRAFVKHDSRLDGAGVLIYPFATLPLATFVGFFFGAPVAFASFFGAMAVVPTGVLINRARGLLAAGFDHADLDVAFRTEIERAREERSFTGGHKPTFLERLLKVVSAGGMSSFLIGIAAQLSGLTARMFPGTFDLFIFGMISVGGNVGVFSGLGYLVLLQRRRDVDSEFWGKLWTGKVGKWLFGIARAFSPKRLPASAMTHRPTELVIAMAADQLFEDLPKHVKKGLADLPQVVARLESDARRMRARLEELQDTIIDDVRPAGPDRDGTQRLVAELRAEREKLQNRLSDTVAALETIRLSLLHLHAGKTSIRSLTTDMNRAREIAADVDRLMEGQREVEVLLKKPDAVTNA
jgi:hypothetical protein